MAGGINSIRRYFRRLIGKPNTTFLMLTESLGLSDDLSLAADYILELNETITQSDSPSSQFDSSITLQELLVLIDAHDILGPTMIQVISLVDSIIFDLSKSITDSMTLSDSLTLIGSDDVLLTENMTLSDSMSFHITMTLLQALGLTDSDNSFGIDFGISETMTLADVISFLITVFSPERPQYSSKINESFDFDSRINNSQSFSSEINDDFDFDSKIE